MRHSWHRYFMDLATCVATRSKDPSTRIGAVIVGPDREVRSTGYNGFPRGIQDSLERLSDREVKYRFTVHAEANAIFNAVRTGTSTVGCTIYVGGLPPCHECAKAIIQAGITDVVYWEGEPPERWRESIQIGSGLLDEAGVMCHMLRKDSTDEPKTVG